MLPFQYIYPENESINVYIYIYIYAAVSNGKLKIEAQANFLIPFTICSSCKWKFVVR